MKNLMDFAIGSIAFFVIGFGLMFGGGGSGLFGMSHFGASDYSDISSLNCTFRIFQVFYTQ